MSATAVATTAPPCFVPTIITSSLTEKEAAGLAAWPSPVMVVVFGVTAKVWIDAVGALRGQRVRGDRDETTLLAQRLLQAQRPQPERRRQRAELSGETSSTTAAARTLDTPTEAAMDPIIRFDLDVLVRCLPLIGLSPPLDSRMPL